MSKFIYVFTPEAKDELIQCGCQLLKHDTRNGIFVFENKPDLIFDLTNIKFALSDVLTF